MTVFQLWNKLQDRNVLYNIVVEGLEVIVDVKAVVGVNWIVDLVAVEDIEGIDEGDQADEGAEEDEGDEGFLVVSVRIVVSIIRKKRKMLTLELWWSRQWEFKYTL